MSSLQCKKKLILRRLLPFTSISLWGDANCDNQVDMSDVVLIMQALANPNKYGLGGTSPSAITKKVRNLLMLIPQ